MNALSKSPLGESVTYAMNQWAAFTVYVRDGDLATLLPTPAEK